jgi:putative peptidoglycan binding protein
MRMRFCLAVLGVFAAGAGCDRAQPAAARRQPAAQVQPAPGLRAADRDSEWRVTDTHFVAELQTRLADLGVYRGPVDGWDSAALDRALAQFQAARGLPQTAKIDAATADALGLRFEDARATPSRPPNRRQPTGRNLLESRAEAQEQPAAAPDGGAPAADSSGGVPAMSPPPVGENTQMPGDTTTPGMNPPTGTTRVGAGQPGGTATAPVLVPVPVPFPVVPGSGAAAAGTTGTSTGTGTSGTGTTLAPSPGTTPAPSPGTTPAPSPGITPAPSPGITPAPSPGTTPAPSPGTTPAPSPGLTAPGAH